MFDNFLEIQQTFLKNVSHVEKLLNDLKLTYQIDSGVVPYNPQEVLITRYVKEVWESRVMINSVPMSGLLLTLIFPP